MPLPPYESSLCFRRFRERHTEVSRSHWSSSLAFEVTSSALGNVPAADYVVDAFRPSFSRGMYPLRAAEMISAIPGYVARLRLQLLVTCCANLEAYLKEITFLHLSSLGHSSDFITLDAIGTALGKPILGNSSLIEPLIYAESLYRVSFGTALTRWKHFYKLRCAAAHSGGVVTPRTLREIPTLKLPLHAQIGLSYKELFEALEAADQIVEVIDRKVVSRSLKRTEIGRELSYLQAAGKLPSKKDVCAFLHKEFRYPRIGKEIRKWIHAQFYP